MDELKLEAEITAKSLDILSDRMSDDPAGYRTDIHGLEALCLSRAAELLRATPSAQEAAKVLQAARSAFEAGCEQGSDEATAYEWGSWPQQTRASAWSDFMAEWNSDSAALRALAGE